MTPRGREEVRSALLESAQQLLARDGLSVTLRQIAAHAGVNLGLVHHYIGNRADLVSAVIERNLDRGHALLPEAADAHEALASMFLLGIKHPEHTALAARLVLDGAGDSLDAQRATVLDAVRVAGDHADGEVPSPAAQALAIAATYGWALFSRQVSESVLGPGANRAAQSDLSGAVAALIEQASRSDSRSGRAQAIHGE